MLAAAEIFRAQPWFRFSVTQFGGFEINIDFDSDQSMVMREEGAGTAKGVLFSRALVEESVNEMLLSVTSPWWR